jgi:15-cis-phytoene synthase
MQDAYRHCESLVREADRDRYLAVLCSPEAARKHLFALYAFNVEISLVGDRAREPMAGEARLVWWREALSGENKTEIAANPVAGALIESMEHFHLPLQWFENILKGRMFDVFTDPMPDQKALDGYLRNCFSPLFSLANRVLDVKTGEADAAAERGGVAYGLTQILRNFPFHASRGKIYVPQDILHKHGVQPVMILNGLANENLKAALAEMRGIARGHLADAQKHLVRLPAGSRYAFLPLALIEPYLSLMDRADYEPFRTPVELSLLRRQWTLWKAAR